MIKNKTIKLIVSAFALAISAESIFADYQNSALVNNASEFEQAVIDVRNGIYDHIKIETAFTCETDLIVSNINRAEVVYIYGKGMRPEHGGTGIDRTYSGQTPPSTPLAGLLTINNCSNIIVEDLWLRNMIVGSESSWSTAGTLNITNSDGVLIQRTMIRDPMFSGIAFVNAKNLNIYQNQIHNSKRFGVWSSPNDLFISENITISQNYIAYSSQAGIALSGQSCIVSGNYLKKCHMNTGEFTTEPSGGQIVIHQNTYDAFITSNYIEKGSIIGEPDGIDRHAHGIEIAPLKVSNIFILDNDILDNDGYGVSMNPGNVSDGIVIVGNRFYNNGLISGLSWNCNEYDDVKYFDSSDDVTIANNTRNGVRVN